VATVSETWRGRHKARGADQSDTAQRVFQVVGAIDEDDACSIVSATFGVSINSQFPAESDTSYTNQLYCHTVFPRLIEGNFMEVTASYGIPKQGYYQITLAPTSLPWKYNWSSVVETQAFDRDITNNPVLNSAYDAPQNPPTKTITYKELVIERNESFYDYATYTPFENTVNSDTIILDQPDGNTVTFDPGTIKCVTICPKHEYTKNDTYVTMAVRLQLYDLSQLSITDPFQLHLLDQGSAGYYGGGGSRGNIVNIDGSTPAQNVALNGHGKPLDTSLLISPVAAGGAPQAPVNCSRGTPPGAVIETAAGSGFVAIYLKWYRYKSVPFASLLSE
jgi:hypothetical protein